MSLYGFFLDPKDALRRTNAGGGGGDTDSKNVHEQAMRTPYHYYENQTFDKSAKVTLPLPLPLPLILILT